jgi:hypothetical protein
MIRLEVEDYCQQCLDFCPDVIKPERTVSMIDGAIVQTDTTIHCEYRKRCAGIKRYLEQQAKGEANG